MPVPTLSLTFLDFQTRVAEFLGIASYGAAGDAAAAPPTDAHDLDLVKRLCNDGWRRFVNSRKNWNWLNPTIAITFDPDFSGSGTVNDATGDVPRAARYYLPSGFFGQLVTRFTYAPSGPRLGIEEVKESHIRELYAGAGETTGDPYLYAVRPLPTHAVGAAPVNSTWEVIFFPAPDGTETVTARARLYPNKLVDDADVTAAGFEFDEAVLAAMLAEADLQRKEGASGKAAVWGDALRRAIEIDTQSGPRHLGYNGDGSDGWGSPRRNYTGVDTYNGVTV